MSTTTCLSCGAAIVWAVTRGRRRPIPIDAEPVDGGNVSLRNGVATIGVPGSGTHVSHFATCPHSAAHRRRRRDDAAVDDALREMDVDPRAGRDVGAK